LRRNDAQREARITAMGQTEVEGVNPIDFLKQLDAFLNDASILVADGGDFVATASYVLRPRGPLRWLDPGVFGTLGVGAGFALGAQLCNRSSEVWLLYGDGAAGYSLQEFDTFVRHGVPVIAVVGNDASWAQIARDQVRILDDDVGTVLRRTAYHTVVEGYGARGILVRTPHEIAPALRDARAAAENGVPVLINVWIGKTDFREGSVSM
jgi:thiamine pyrophosphate-dependent acetolactate synthase large subunit-like protein